MAWGLLERNRWIGSVWSIALVTAVATLALQQAARCQQLQVSNPLNIDRGQEVIEVPLGQVIARMHISAAKASELVATDAATRQRIPIQAYSSRAGAEPDTLLLLVNLPARGSEKIAFALEPDAPALEPLVFGRPVPERKDDFSWENKTVAYRMYGPALEATGEISSGIDVWSKRPPHFVVDSFYKRDHDAAAQHNPALSYHKDDGIGLDSYDVSKTRGCGGTGVWADGKLNVSKNYTKVEILSRGPIRFEFVVSYAPWVVTGRTVTESKRITLDAGSHLNRIVSTYSFDGDSPLQLAAGIAIHAGASDTVSKEKAIAAVWDTPQDPSAGRIATGLVALPAQNAKTTEAAEHALLLFTRRSGEPFTYYAGSGWSKADMPTAADWNAYLDKFYDLRKSPVAVSWTAR